MEGGTGEWKEKEVMKEEQRGDIKALLRRENSPVDSVAGAVDLSVMDQYEDSDGEPRNITGRKRSHWHYIVKSSEHNEISKGGEKNSSFTKVFIFDCDYFLISNCSMICSLGKVHRRRRCTPCSNYCLDLFNGGHLEVNHQMPRSYC